MSDAALLRWLDLVVRQLGAVDARVEIGGHPPRSERALWTELPGGRRVVVLFEDPIERVLAKQQRLHALVESFAGMAGGGSSVVAPPAGARAELDEALARLAARADAAHALVIDSSSPVLWGSSHERPAIAVAPETVQRRTELIERATTAGLDVADWLTARAAGARGSATDVERAAIARSLGEEFSAALTACANVGRSHWLRLVLVTQAIAACRQQVAAAGSASTTLRGGAADEPATWLARPFASIYLLLIVFDGPVSQLHAEGAMIQSMGAIERLVLNLPPVDPPRRGARVIRLKR